MKIKIILLFSCSLLLFRSCEKDNESPLNKWIQGTWVYNYTDTLIFENEGIANFQNHLLCYEFKSDSLKLWGCNSSNSENILQYLFYYSVNRNANEFTLYNYLNNEKAKFIRQ
jgi:hypothetical protein